MGKPSYEELEKELFALKTLQASLSKDQEELKQSQENLKTSYAFLDQIVNNIYDPVFVKDDQSRMTHVNDAFCHLFDVPRIDVIGKTLAEHVPLSEREHFLKIDKNVLASGKDSLIEESLSVIGKSPLTIRTKKTRFINKDGAAFLIGVIHDITDSKKNEVELNHAKEKAEESERLKSAFLANMSHEIRTPMNGILGFSQLLKRTNISSEKRKNYLNLIDFEGKRLLNIISDIVDISKIDSNNVRIEMSSCNINSLIDDLYLKYSISTLSEKIVLKAKKGLNHKGSTIKTDSNRLVQILSNLIENALKFTEEGTVEFGYSLVNNELKFYVTDSGPGIDPSELQHIFGRFNQGKQHQTYHSGSGLGLSIAKGLTKLIGGEVWVESVIDDGATFFVQIPYEKVITETDKARDGERKAHLNNNDFTVLIAEDAHLIFMYLKEVLSDFNCSILHAIHGKEAVKMFEQNSSIDIILMDIDMPEMNGYEALKEIRKTNKAIPIIAQSGMAMSDDKEKALEAGFDDYISKPIAEDVLITIMNKHLKKHN